jgi:hypothetical protein
VHLIDFIIRIYHDARSPEYQTQLQLEFGGLVPINLFCIFANLNPVKRTKKLKKNKIIFTVARFESCSCLSTGPHFLFLNTKCR